MKGVDDAVIAGYVTAATAYMVERMRQTKLGLPTPATAFGWFNEFMQAAVAATVERVPDVVNVEATAWDGLEQWSSREYRTPGTERKLAANVERAGLGRWMWAAYDPTGQRIGVGERPTKGTAEDACDAVLKPTGVVLL